MEFTDVPKYTFSGFSEMLVRCPKCGGAGVVELDWDSGIAGFRCNACYFSEEKAPGRESCEVSGQCEHCGRYYRIYLEEQKYQGPKLKAACPYCRETTTGEVTIRKDHYIYADPADGQDPYFHYPLYFQDDFRGKLIWALNREHLQYLIDYINADLRKTPISANGFKTQGAKLPAFMKAAKHRAEIVKLLEKMQKQA